MKTKSKHGQPTEPLELFCIGPAYHQRTFMMGELYEVGDRGHRLAWDLLGDYLARGQAVTIRPATADELAWAEAEMARHEAFERYLRERSTDVTRYDKLLKGE